MSREGGVRISPLLMLNLYYSNTYNAVLDYQSKNNLDVDSLLLTGRWK